MDEEWQTGLTRNVRRSGIFPVVSPQPSRRGGRGRSPGAGDQPASGERAGPGACPEAASAARPAPGVKAAAPRPARRARPCGGAFRSGAAPKPRQVAARGEPLGPPGRSRASTRPAAGQGPPPGPPPPRSPAPPSSTRHAHTAAPAAHPGAVFIGEVPGDIVHGAVQVSASVRAGHSRARPGALLKGNPPLLHVNQIL